MTSILFRITLISGGQTGADRAALEFAIEHNIPHGGWCPKGRKAEDGPINARFHLTETPSANYLQRTEWNVRDSDATLIFTIAGPTLSGGSKRTWEFAKKHGKPALHLSHVSTPEPAEALRHFLSQHHITRLNVAGTRGSKEPEVSGFVMAILKKLLVS